MIRLRSLCVVVLTALTFSAAPTEAAPLILNYSGTFGSTSTLDGVAFDADTPFSFRATFDSTPDETFVGGAVAVFSAVVTFDIAGFGTFTSDPTASVGVLLLDDSFGKFGAGLATTGDGASSFFSRFSTATPPYLVEAPIPTVFTDFSANFTRPVNSSRNP